MTEPTDEDPDRIDDDTIARRAYELSQSEDAGTPEENWVRAERELRALKGETRMEPDQGE